MKSKDLLAPHIYLRKLNQNMLRRAYCDLLTRACTASSPRTHHRNLLDECVFSSTASGSIQRIRSNAFASSPSSSKKDDAEWEDLPQTEEELADRRAKALRKWLENEVGEERASLMTILGTHKVKVPGGGEEAKAFMDDLLLWKAKGQLLAEEETKKNEKRFEKEFGLPFEYE